MEERTTIIFIDDEIKIAYGKVLHRKCTVCDRKYFETYPLYIFPFYPQGEIKGYLIIRTKKQIENSFQFSANKKSQQVAVKGIFQFVPSEIAHLFFKEWERIDEFIFHSPFKHTMTLLRKKDNIKEEFLFAAKDCLQCYILKMKEKFNWKIGELYLMQEEYPRFFIWEAGIRNKPVRIYKYIISGRDFSITLKSYKYDGILGTIRVYKDGQVEITSPTSEKLYIPYRKLNFVYINFFHPLSIDD